MTLTDLPGLVYKELGQGDKIISMIKRFAENKNAIILIVAQCNAEIFNNPISGILKDYDPNRERTFFVLTHIDQPFNESNKQYL